MQKIIISGAAGEVGLNLLSIMDLKKYSIIALDKNENNLKILKRLFPKVITKRCDLAQKGDWEKVFKGADAVIQLQAQISSPHEEDYVRNNIESVKNILYACEKYKIKHLVHASSSVIISVAKDHYTITKRKGEGLVVHSKVPYTILRPTLMYGCFDIKHLGYLTTFFDKSPVFPMPGSGEYVRQPLYVEDFCRIILKCLDMPPRKKIYNIAGKEKINLIDMLKIISKERRKRVMFLKIPLPIFYFLIKVYGIMDRKTKIVPDQLTALTAGDIFPVIKWDSIFGVAPTGFLEGARKMVKSRYYRYADEMTKIDS